MKSNLSTWDTSRWALRSHSLLRLGGAQCCLTTRTRAGVAPRDGLAWLDWPVHRYHPAAAKRRCAPRGNAAGVTPRDAARRRVAWRMRACKLHGRNPARPCCAFACTGGAERRRAAAAAAVWRARRCGSCCAVPQEPLVVPCSSTRLAASAPVTHARAAQGCSSPASCRRVRGWARAPALSWPWRVPFWCFAHSRLQGGPVVTIWGFIIVFVASIGLMLSMAEISSRYIVAGGPYTVRALCRYILARPYSRAVSCSGLRWACPSPGWAAFRAT